jgi:exopolysaccharide biosynthesis polyprenyl glycosylphosphotransferase
MSLGTYRKLILIAGDTILLVCSLALTLLLRSGSGGFLGAWELHILPFTLLFAVWLLIFYIAGLYEVRATSDLPIMLRYISYSMIAGGIIAIGIFYFVPAFRITPRINLIIDLFVTSILISTWRIFFANTYKMTSKIRLLLLGDSPDIEELARTIIKYPQLGYTISARITHAGTDILPILKEKRINIVVAPKEIQQDNFFVQAIYETLHKGMRFMDASLFYERLLGKIPVSLISKVWFLENISETEKIFFEALKRVIDILLSFIVGIITLPLILLAIIAIKLNSSGPTVLKQRRVGKMGRVYNHYKLRTMATSSPDGHAEPNGVQWSMQNDSRVTRVGKILRGTRIDELPQLWNILRGELSFVGPRPERPEFVEMLRREIPYYDMRHLVRPGLSGWAQINPPYYYASTKETVLKLQYDLFYIKNRDLGLDLAIALKTLMVIVSRQGR